MSLAGVKRERSVWMHRWRTDAPPSSLSSHVDGNNLFLPELNELIADLLIPVVMETQLNGFIGACKST